MLLQNEHNSLKNTLLFALKSRMKSYCFKFERKYFTKLHNLRITFSLSIVHFEFFVLKIFLEPMPVVEIKDLSIHVDKKLGFQKNVKC